MKQLIIIIGTIILGVYIFNMMVGNNPSSLKNISKEIMLETIEKYEALGTENAVMPSSLQLAPSQQILLQREVQA